MTSTAAVPHDFYAAAMPVEKPQPVKKIQPVSKALPVAAAAPTGRSTRRRGLVETEILDTAATLFAARGFAATSMQDLADALEISRPSLYHYFKSKDEILVRLMEGLADGARRAVNEAKTSTAAPDVTLRELIAGLVLPIAESPGRFRLVYSTDATAQYDTAGQMSKVQREVVKAVSGTISAGIASGHFRRGDERIATMTLLGMVNWVAWWYAPGRDQEASELAATIADLAVETLRAHDANRSGATARDVITSMQKDLQQLLRLTEET